MTNINNLNIEKDDNTSTWSMESFLDQIDKKNFFGNKKELNGNSSLLSSSKRIILIKQIMFSEIKCYVSLKLDNIEMFFH